MKTIKILMALLIVTIITNSHDIYAYNVATIVNKEVPGFNGSYYTDWYNIPTASMARHHKVRDIDVSRELDVRVEKKKGSKGSWALLQTGSSDELTNSLSHKDLYMCGGDFQLHINSRIYYVTKTKINNVLWYLEV